MDGHLYYYSYFTALKHQNYSHSIDRIEVYNCHCHSQILALTV